MKNTVLIGLGSIFPLHVSTVSELGKLYGVCDIIKEKADENAEKYSCKAFYDIDDVLKDANVDCIHILTPHYLHFDMARKASEAGKTVVLEKPAVMNMKEFSALLEIFEKNNTKNLVVFQNRYNPCMVYLKEHFSELTEKFGAYKGSKGILTWRRDEKYYNSTEWRGKYKTEGGGLLINQAPHIIDLLLYIGGEIESFEGKSSLHVLKDIIEVEDTCEAVFNFKNRTRSLFYGTNGYISNSPYDIEFIFENEIIRYMYGKLYKISDMSVLAEDVALKGEKGYWGNSHKTLIRKFYNGETCPTLNEYKQVCEIIETLVKTKGKG